MASPELLLARQACLFCKHHYISKRHQLSYRREQVKEGLTRLEFQDQLLALSDAALGTRRGELWDETNSRYTVDCGERHWRV
jgi:hypothetical protein